VLDDEFVSSSRGGFHRFLVQWFGRPQSDATWIIEDEFCELNPTLVESYLSPVLSSFQGGSMMQLDIKDNYIPEEIGNLEI